MPQDTITITQPPVAGPTTATIGVPDNAIDQVKSLIPAGGHADGVTVMLALVGVAGGGAAFKLYQNLTKNNAEKSEREHELQMKKMELEHQNGDQHKACAVERASLEARVAALSARLEEVSQRAEKLSSMSISGFDADSLEDRLEKIEKTLKPAKKSRAAKGKA